MRIALPADVAVDAEVDLGTSGDQFLLRARLNVSLPVLESDVARAVTEGAHQVCPHSKATRGNIDVDQSYLNRQSQRTRESTDAIEQDAR